jgi:hypothetical protein
VPPQLRQHWDTVLLNVLEEDAHLPSDAAASTSARAQSAGAQATINLFFRAFIDHAFRDLDYIITVGR